MSRLPRWRPSTGCPPPAAPRAPPGRGRGPARAQRRPQLPAAPTGQRPPRHPGRAAAAAGAGEPRRTAGRDTRARAWYSSSASDVRRSSTSASSSRSHAAWDSDSPPHAAQAARTSEGVEDAARRCSVAIVRTHAASSRQVPASALPSSPPGLSSPDASPACGWPRGRGRERHHGCRVRDGRLSAPCYSRELTERRCAWAASTSPLAAAPRSPESRLAPQRRAEHEL